MNIQHHIQMIRYQGYISSALTYYAQRVSTTNSSEIVIFENPTIS